MFHRWTTAKSAVAVILIAVTITVSIPLFLEFLGVACAAIGAIAHKLHAIHGVDHLTHAASYGALSIYSGKSAIDQASRLIQRLRHPQAETANLRALAEDSLHCLCYFALSAVSGIEAFC